jgi:hypothetical protein
MGVQAGVAYNDEGREQAGMGVAVADFFRDGKFDIFKTNFADDTHTFIATARRMTLKMQPSKRAWR